MCLSLTLYARIVSFLVEKHPSSLTDEDKYYETPLHLAAKHGRTEMVDFLIRGGAKVEARWEALWVTPIQQYINILIILYDTKSLRNAIFADWPLPRFCKNKFRGSDSIRTLSLCPT